MSQIFVSKNNTTIIPLGAGETFVGGIDVLTSFEELDINIAGTPTNASGTLYFEFSPDGTNWDVSIPMSYADLTSPPIILRSVLPYFRVRYINGSTPHTIFRLTTVLHKTGSMRLTRFLFQDIDPNEPIEMVRIAKGERSSQAISSSVDASISNTSILLDNSSRSGATIFNDSTATLYLNLGSTASLSSYTVKVIPGAYYETPFNYTGIINGIWDLATGNARVTEFS